VRGGSCRAWQVRGAAGPHAERQELDSATDMALLVVVLWSLMQPFSSELSESAFVGAAARERDEGDS
jgi:hypothetical protein